MCSKENVDFLLEQTFSRIYFLMKENFNMILVKNSIPIARNGHTFVIL